MDPLGNIPMYLSALKNVPPERRTKIIVRELFIALIIMVLFLFAGSHFLAALKISDPALTVTGGVILFLIAIKMIFPPDHPTDAPLEEPFIVPLAIPYLAGPSTLASLILIMNSQPERWPEWLAALLGAWLVCGVILVSAVPLAKILRQRGLVAIERLMGMILVALAIQMLMTGIQEFIATLII
ncbi:UNVERIFIED_CONTAM: hypothetical protein GTU68_003657 [Idotea baltica]|nr:hypothetical protein [Idotea baltica]